MPKQSEERPEFMEFTTTSKAWEEHARVSLTKGQWQLRWTMELNGNTVVRVRVGRKVLGTYQNGKPKVPCTITGKKLIAVTDADDFVFECKMNGETTAEIKRGKFLIRPVGR